MKTLPATALALLLAACGGGGADDTAVSSGPAPVVAPAPVAQAPAPASPALEPAPVAQTPPPAAQPPAAAPPTTTAPAPIRPVPTEPAKPSEPPEASPPAAEPDRVVTYAMKCRGNPPRPDDTWDALIAVEINWSGQPWKSLRVTEVQELVYPVPPFATDPDGALAAANPGPLQTAHNLPEAGGNAAASYHFEGGDLQWIQAWPFGTGRGAFPYVCVRL